MAEFLGADLSKINKELDKLMLITEKGEINLETIEQNIGISKDFNNFELNNAVARKDVLRANLISNYFCSKS